LKIKHNTGYKSPTYRDKRRAEYAPTGDQLDAILELGRALRDKKIIDPFPQKVDDWIRHCDNVKAKYTKP